MQFRITEGFAKEFKRLVKKYRTLSDDLSKFEKVLAVFPCGNGSKHWNRIHVSADGEVEIFKVRLACASMKGESRFRVIYAYNRNDGSIEHIDFIDIYFKGDRANEDRDLIEEYKRGISG